MAAPVVQSIEQIIADLNPAYQPLISTIQAKQAAIPGQFAAQRSGLDAAKVQGFNQINNQATGRGMSFSGIPLDEQSNYLSTKYLPGMQMLAQQENDQNLAMTEALAKIDQERRLRSMDIRTDQSKRLESYLSEQRQMEWDKQKFAQTQALERARLAQSASQNAQPTTYSWTKNKSGGYDTSGGVDLATAVKSQGGGISNLVSLLQNGSKSDKAAAAYYMKTVGKNPVAAYNYLVQKTGAFYKGGGF